MENRITSQVLTNVFSVLDSERFLCADCVIQAALKIHYEEYTTSVKVTNLL